VESPEMMMTRTGKSIMAATVTTAYRRNTACSRKSKHCPASLFRLSSGEQNRAGDARIGFRQPTNKACAVILMARQTSRTALHG
jgi:hypothetical protein